VRGFEKPSYRTLGIVWITLLSLTISAYAWDAFSVDTTFGNGENYTDITGYHAGYEDYEPAMEQTLIDTIRDYREHKVKPSLMDRASGIWPSIEEQWQWNSTNYDLEFVNLSFTGQELTVEIYLSHPYQINVTVLDGNLSILNRTASYNDDLWVVSRNWDSPPKHLSIEVTRVLNVTEEGTVFPVDNTFGEGETVFFQYLNWTIRIDDLENGLTLIRGEFDEKPMVRMGLYYAYGILFTSLILCTGELLSLHMSDRPPRGKGIRRMIWRYKWHFLVFYLVYLLKNVSDVLNDPIRDWHGLDFTSAIHALEGNSVLHIQNFLLADGTTLIFASYYTMGFVFMNIYLLVYFMWKDDWEMNTRVQFNYLFIYMLAVPFYFFIPVFVTSVGVPGMRALLYDYDPMVHNWAFSVDVFDNCFPSLHVGVPTTAAVIVWLECKRRGQTVKEAGYVQPFFVVVASAAIYSVSVLYLGIHWVVDVPAGVMLGVGCGFLTHELGEPLSKRMRHLNRKVDQYVGERLTRKLVGYHEERDGEEVDGVTGDEEPPEH